MKPQVLVPKDHANVNKPSQRMISKGEKNCCNYGCVFFLIQILMFLQVEVFQ